MSIFWVVYSSLFLAICRQQWSTWYPCMSWCISLWWIRLWRINLPPVWVSYHWMNAFLQSTCYTEWKCALQYSLIISVLVSDVISDLDLFWSAKKSSNLVKKSIKWTYINNYGFKKNSACGGKKPRALYKRRPLTQAEKTPELLPHPYMGVPLPVWVWAGTFLSCFGMAACEGIFLIPAWNSLPPGVEPRTWGVLLMPPNQSS